MTFAAAVSHARLPHGQCHGTTGSRRCRARVEATPIEWFHVEPWVGEAAQRAAMNASRAPSSRGPPDGAICDPARADPGVEPLRMVELGARERIRSAVLSGSDDRLCQPEGRRRQDDDGGQSGDLSGPRRRRVLVVDLDPQGNATSGFGIDRADARVTRCTTRSSTTVPLRDRRHPDRRRRAARSAPSSVGPRRRRGRARADSHSANAGSRGRSTGSPGRYDYDPHRLPAVARAADGERADRRRLRSSSRSNASTTPSKDSPS